MPKQDITIAFDALAELVLKTKFDCDIPKNLEVVDIELRHDIEQLILSIDVPNPKEIKISLFNNDGSQSYSHLCEKNTPQLTLERLTSRLMDFSNIDFRKVEIKYGDGHTKEVELTELKNLDFSGTNLSNSNFSGLKLTNIDINTAILFCTNFKNCNMKKVDLGKGGVIG